MSEDAKEKHNDTRQFALGAVCILSGITMAFIAAFAVDTEASPRGTISGSVLGYIGEAFTLGGSLVGAVQYVKYKTKREVTKAAAVVEQKLQEILKEREENK